MVDGLPRLPREKSRKWLRLLRFRRMPSVANVDVICPWALLWLRRRLLTEADVLGCTGCSLRRSIMHLLEVWLPKNGCAYCCGCAMCKCLDQNMCLKIEP